MKVVTVVLLVVSVFDVAVHTLRWWFAPTPEIATAQIHYATLDALLAWMWVQTFAGGRRRA